MALSPDGRTLGTSYWGPEVKLWDIVTGLQLGALTNNSHKAWSLAFSADGALLATAGADQLVRLWNVATRRQIEQLKGHGSEVMAVAFSPDGQTLASGGKDKCTMLWSIHPNRPVTTLSNIVSRAPVFSPDGRLIAAGIGQDKVAAWDTATLQVQRVFDGAYYAVGFSADGSALVTCGTNYFLRTFDLATPAAPETVSRGPVAQADSYSALSPDSHILATGFADGTLAFFDATTGLGLASVAHAYATNFFKLTFSPNGKLLATAGIPNESEGLAPKIWNTATHQMVAAPPGHTDLVIDAAFAPDGKTLVTCAVDDSIKFWDTATWKEILPSLGQKEYVNAVAFSPDANTLASSAADGTLKLWNVGTRRELATLKPGWDYWYMTFSPDGQTLAVKCWDRTIRVLRAPGFDRQQIGKRSG
jgi:WD40 repeat protein